MQQINIGIQLASLRQPFKKALHTAARLGARCVEIDARNEVVPRDMSQTGLRQVRKMLEDLNLRVAAIRFRTERGYQASELLDRRVAATKDAMKLAYLLGAPVVVNQVGTVPPESTGHEWGTLTDALTDLGRYGQHVGAFLAAETGTESGADLKRLLSALPAGFIAVDLNPGNLIINGFSPREAVEQLGQYILHVHARDGVRDLAQGRGLEVALGRGSADFHELLGLLEEHTYRGPVTIERHSAEDPVREIGVAVQYLQNL